MASLKAVKERMRSVDGIKKITSAMKMVSAAKFKNDERRMLMGLPFAAPAPALLSKLPETKTGQQLTIVALASDKGLCGAINSAVCKQARLTLLEEEKKGTTVNIIGVGNKVAAALRRLYGDRLVTTFEEVKKPNWNFTNACLIAERIAQQNPDRVELISNKFKSLIAYDTDLTHMYAATEVKTIDKTEWSKVVDQFEFEPGTFEVWQDLHEFYYATAIFGKYLNGVAAEEAARMAAMENATKNCGEIVEKLTVQYNRARQAKITTELCEIISGASAV